jgi:hypothetical protein
MIVIEKQTVLIIALLHIFICCFFSYVMKKKIDIIIEKNKRINGVLLANANELKTHNANDTSINILNLKLI